MSSMFSLYNPGEENEVTNVEVIPNSSSAALTLALWEQQQQHSIRSFHSSAFKKENSSGSSNTANRRSTWTAYSINDIESTDGKETELVSTNSRRKLFFWKKKKKSKNPNEKEEPSRTNNSETSKSLKIHGNVSDINSTKTTRKNSSWHQFLFHKDASCESSLEKNVGNTGFVKYDENMDKLNGITRKDSDSSKVTHQIMKKNGGHGKENDGNAINQVKPKIKNVDCKDKLRPGKKILGASSDTIILDRLNMETNSYIGDVDKCMIDEENDWSKSRLFSFDSKFEADVIQIKQGQQNIHFQSQTLSEYERNLLYAQRWKAARLKHKEELKQVNLYKTNKTVGNVGVSNNDCVQNMTESSGEIFYDAYERVWNTMQYEEPYQTIRQNSTRTTKKMSNRLEDDSIGSLTMHSHPSKTEIKITNGEVDARTLCADGFYCLNEKYKHKRNAFVKDADRDESNIDINAASSSISYQSGHGKEDVEPKSLFSF